MRSETAILALLATLATAACAGNSDVSMDGVWRLEGVAGSARGSCRLIGDFRVDGSTTDGFHGAGTFTFSGTKEGTSFEHTDSASVSDTHLNARDATPPMSVFEFRRREPLEPDLASGTWTCVIDNTGGWDPVYIDGNWVMRRIQRESVEVFPVLGPS